MKNKTNRTFYAVFPIFLSLIFPGLGQLFNGKIILGWIIITLIAFSTIIAKISIYMYSNGYNYFITISASVLMELIIYVYAAVHCIKFSINRRNYKVDKVKLLYNFSIYAALLIINNYFNNEVMDINYKQLRSSSMAPGIMANEYFVIWENYYLNHDPYRGDVVMFRGTIDNDVNWIKRIVGIPGDRVRISRGVLFVNEKIITKTTSNDENEFPAGCRNGGADTFVEKFFGKQPYCVITSPNSSSRFDWPDVDESGTVPSNKYFVLGDNRNKSADSRFKILGFIPRENITHKPILIVWSQEWHRIGLAIQSPVTNSLEIGPQ